MRELKIGFLQQHNVEDIKNNIERLAEGITNLAQRGAELVILQELHNFTLLLSDRGRKQV